MLNRGELGYVIRGIGLVQTLDDLGNIVVTQHNGTPILVRDLGKLKLSNQERHGVVGQDDKNDVVEGTVLLLRHENPSRVLEGVHAKIDELNAQLKADDVQIVPYLDRTNLVNSTIDKVEHTVFSGIGLVLIVLILFLGSPRSALDRRHHRSVCNGGGLHPDVPRRNFRQPAVARRHRLRHHRRRRHRDDGSNFAAARGEAGPSRLTEAEVRDAARQVARPIFFATAIIITTYLPLFAFQRDRGQAVLSDGLCGRLRAARRAGCSLLLVIPGLAYVAYRRPRRVFHNPVARLDRAELPGRPAPARCTGRASPICSAAGAAIAVIDPRRHGLA